MTEPLTFSSAGPVLAPEVVAEFEKKRGVTAPLGVREFLLNVSNGGVPSRTRFEIGGGHWDPPDDISYFYGLGHINRDWRLEDWFDDYRDYAAGGWWPLASTHASGFVVVEPRKGRDAVVYVDWNDELDGKGMKRTWPLAKTVAEFCAGLRVG